MAQRIEHQCGEIEVRGQAISQLNSLNKELIENMDSQ